MKKKIMILLVICIAVFSVCVVVTKRKQAEQAEPEMSEDWIKHDGIPYDPYQDATWEEVK